MAPSYWRRSWRGTGARLAERGKSVNSEDRPRERDVNETDPANETLAPLQTAFMLSDPAKPPFYS